MLSAPKSRLLAGFAFVAFAALPTAGGSRAEAAPDRGGPAGTLEGIEAAPADLPNAVVDLATPAPKTTYGGWHSIGANNEVLIPHTEFADGAVDVVFDFHAAQMADHEWRAIGAPVVVISDHRGMGSGPYSTAYASPSTFTSLLDTALRVVRHEMKTGPLHVRHVTLVAWSAGYGAAMEILRNDAAYARVDTLVLLDAIHGGYVRDAQGNVPEEGKRTVNLQTIAPFARFARDAAAGKKEFVLAHTSIVPPGYASTTECASALMDDVGAKRVVETSDGPDGLVRNRVGEAGHFHVWGYAGGTPGAHVAMIRLLPAIFDELALPFRAAEPGPELAPEHGMGIAMEPTEPADPGAAIEPSAP